MQLCCLHLSQADQSEYVVSAKSGHDSGVVASSIPQGPFGGLQRRLVHQIVRADFPSLITHGRKDAVAVQFKNAEVEVEQKTHNDKKLKGLLFEQMGFRLITEALASGSLESIDIHQVGRGIHNEHTPTSTKLFEKRLGELEKSLQEHQTVLVGHNCFLDLVYIYRTFYGTLPNTVEEFQAALHEIFPLIIDTKFMATSLPEDEHRNLQLFELDEALAGSKVPVIGNVLIVTELLAKLLF